MRQKLTLKKRVDPSTRPVVDPMKVALSERMGWRYVDRGGRYIQQHLVVTYEFVCDQNREVSRTWMDVPLVPEVYCG